MTPAGTRAAQLEARPVDEEEYRAYRTATDLREPYRWLPGSVGCSEVCAAVLEAT